MLQKEKRFIPKEKKADYAPDAGIRSKKTANILTVMIAVDITGIITERYLTVFRNSGEKDMSSVKRITAARAAEYLSEKEAKILFARHALKNSISIIQGKQSRKNP